MAKLSRRTFLKGSTAAATAATLGARTSSEEAIVMAQGIEQQAEPDTGGRALRVGAASGDITPEPGVPMWGYTDREGPATGTLDPLYAKAVVLRAGGKTVALVVYDLGRVPMAVVRARLREAARNLGIDDLILTATHTHGAPMVELDPSDHVAKIERVTLDILKRASEGLTEARMGLTRIAIDIAHNRRFYKDGTCYMMWRNEERVPTSPVDKEAAILHFEDLSGNALATLVNYACHPVVLAGDNREYTADWCGEMARLVKEKTGGECLFLQGGAGDINPYLDKTPRDKGGVEAMRRTGREAADAVLAGLAAVRCAAPETPSLLYREEPVDVGTRWDFQDPEVQAIFKGMYGDLFQRYLDMIVAGLNLPVGVLVLNNDTALAFVPGEFFAQYQLDLKAHSPLRNTFLCGYALDFHLYFPTIRGAADRGYGGAIATYVGIGAGDKMIAKASTLIGEAIGRLNPKPEAADFQLVDYVPGQV